MTAAQGQHGVHEVTFVIQGGERTVFFGGDSLRVPELDTIPDRFGHVDLAILPTNGLCIRPMNPQQVVMNAQEAAGLTAGVFYLYEIYADTGAFRVHLATGHVAHFFTELAQHSTADAKALVQLVELHAP